MMGMLRSSWDGEVSYGSTRPLPTGRWLRRGRRRLRGTGKRAECTRWRTLLNGSERRGGVREGSERRGGVREGSEKRGGRGEGDREKGREGRGCQREGEG